MKTAQNRVDRHTVAYWLTRVSKPRLSQSFRVPIQHQKKCHRFTLIAQDEQTAATQALEIYQHLLAHDWARTVQKYGSTNTGPRKETTIGEWLESLVLMPGLDATLFAKHAQAIRQIARDHVGMGEESKRFVNDHALRPNFPTGMSKTTALRAVEADKLPLSILSPMAVKEWEHSCVTRAGNSPDSRQRAQKFVQAEIEAASSLFSANFIKFVAASLPLPSRLPFELPTGAEIPDGLQLPKLEQTVQFYSVSRGQFEIESDPIIEPIGPYGWPDLFQVYRTSDHQDVTKRVAKPIGRLRMRQIVLTAAEKDDRLAPLILSLCRLSGIPPDALKQTRQHLNCHRIKPFVHDGKEIRLSLPPNSLRTIQSALEIVDNLLAAFDPELSELRKPLAGDTQETDDRTADLLGRVQKALREHHRRSLAPLAHDGAETYPYQMPYGQEVEATLPWLAIEFARTFVERELRLPSKRQLKGLLVSAYPQLKERKRREFWREIWKAAALDTLPDR